jgi:excisionase family DNA binding protein
MPATSRPTTRPATRNLAAIEPISMRIPDACRFTGISRSTLYLLIAQGEVEIIKLGASTLVLTASLKRFVEKRRGSGTDFAARH